MADTDDSPHFGRLIAGITVFVIAGAPMVAYLWETLNMALALHVTAARVLVSLPVLAVFAGMLYLLSRRVQAWERRSSETQREV